VLTYSRFAYGLTTQLTYNGFAEYGFRVTSRSGESVLVSGSCSGKLHSENRCGDATTLTRQTRHRV
jgi:hypothetical protein